MASTRTWNILLATAVANISTPLPTRVEDKVSDDAVRVIEKVVVTGLGGAAAGHYNIAIRSAGGADLHIETNVEAPAGVAFTEVYDFADGVPLLDLSSHGTNRQYSPNSGLNAGTDDRCWGAVTGTAAVSGYVHIHYKWVRPSPLRD